MRTIYTRARWIASGLLIGTIAVLYAQEPARFERGLEIIRGELSMQGVAGNTISFEGATGNAFETRIIVTDPTADRTFTIGNGDNVFALVEPSEIVTATNVLTTAECGSTFYLNAAAGFLTTLPAPSAGCTFKFVVFLAPTSNGYTIGTPTANIIDGMVVERAGGAGVACADEDLLTLVANQSISGDWLDIRSDTTNWYVHGMTDVSAGFTCAAT